MDADDPRNTIPNLNPTSFDAAVSNGLAIAALAEAVKLLVACLERNGMVMANKDTILGLADSSIRVSVKRVK